MKRLLQWLLLPTLMVAVLTLALPQRADARVRVRVGYPGYYVGYRPYYAGYWGPGALWVPPVRVYRPAVVVPRTIVVPAPIVVPPYAPYYQVWE